MDEQLQQAMIAVAATKKLSELHQKFVANLAASAAEGPDIGTFSVSSDSIAISCLERNISVLSRAIVLNKHISALEYDFVTRWKDEELSILRLYLQPGGVLTRDPNGKENFCDFNNTYIHRKILSALSESLLNSPVYAPAEG
jgi:hypothetical protein